MRLGSLVSPSIFVLLIAALCSGYPAESQAKTGAKSDILGHWAAPDCARVEEAASFTRHFYLTSAPDRLQLRRYTPTGTGGDHLILMVGGEKMPVMRQEDGVLRTGTYAVPEQKGDTWENLQLATARDFANCPAVPAVIPKPLQRLARYLDRIDEACAMTGGASTTAPKNLSQDCARVLFKAADDNGDNKVTELELKRALVSAVLLGRLAGGAPLQGDAITAAATDAKRIADQTADNIMAAQDSNRDGALDYNESVGNFSAAELSALQESLQDIGHLFPVFGLAGKL